jgi:hypothetical protein
LCEGHRESTVDDNEWRPAVKTRRTSDRWYLVAFALIATMAGTPEAARAQASVEGRYGFVAAESADVREAIREGTADANFFVRNVGRGVLQRMLCTAGDSRDRGGG